MAPVRGGRATGRRDTGRRRRQGEEVPGARTERRPPSASVRPREPRAPSRRGRHAKAAPTAGRPPRCTQARRPHPDAPAPPRRPAPAQSAHRRADPAAEQPPPPPSSQASGPSPVAPCRRSPTSRGWGVGAHSGERTRGRVALYGQGSTGGGWPVGRSEFAIRGVGVRMVVDRLIPFARRHTEARRVARSLPCRG